MAAGCSHQSNSVLVKAHQDQAGGEREKIKKKQQQQGGGILMRKGPWTEQEDVQLVWFVRLLGERRWDFLAKVSGLQRTGKSCRLRWVNYLHPGLKRGRMSPDEERLVVQLHAKWGNRWSRIAKSMPGRTDNEIKNYWRTHMRKANKNKQQQSTSCSSSSSSNTHLQPASRLHRHSCGELEEEGEESATPASQEQRLCMDQLLLPLWNDDIDADCCWNVPMPASPLWDVAYCSDSLWGSAHQDDDDDYINMLDASS